MLVDVLLVVGDQGLGDGLADGVDLRSVTTTADPDADIYCDREATVSPSSFRGLFSSFPRSLRFLNPPRPPNQLLRAGGVEHR